MVGGVTMLMILCVCVLGDGLISVPDLDPLGLRLQPHTRRIGVARHLGFKAPGHDTVIQVALISETTRYAKPLSIIYSFEGDSFCE